MTDDREERIAAAAARASRNPPALIPLDQCRVGTIYRVRSRNLIVAVCADLRHGSFIGIREKLGSEYLFAEYHNDTGSSLGTLRPERVLGEVPEGVQLIERNPTQCDACGREVEFPKSNFDLPPAERHWHHVDDGTPIEGHPVSTTYEPLFKLLQSYEAQEGP